MTNITMYDQLRVPAHLQAGEYVLGFRWDCESSAQVWQACADITIAA
jgi:lytic starch monooxygenase